MAVPKNIVPAPRKGPVRMRKSGSGVHVQGIRRQRSRSDRERKAKEFAFA